MYHILYAVAEGQPNATGSDRLLDETSFPLSLPLMHSLPAYHIVMQAQSGVVPREVAEEDARLAEEERIAAQSKAEEAERQRVQREEADRLEAERQAAERQEALQ